MAGESTGYDFINPPLYNITESIPLASGYYTSTTARAAVPIPIRKLGFELRYEVSAGVWYKEMYIGTSLSGWTTASNWVQMPDKAYVDSGLALKVNRAEVDYIRYSDRVVSDGGTIRDKSLLKAMYDDALNLLPNTDLWFNFECGIKTRISGLNTYVAKAYDLSPNNRDASQTTEASQPYLVGNINPANRLAIWGLNRLFPLSSSVAKITTDKWTLAVSVKSLGGLCEFIGSTNTRLSVTTAATDSITFKNESGTSVSLNLLSKIVGTSARIYFVAKGDGTMQVWLNGVLQGTLSNPTNATFANLYGSANGELKAIRLFNKDLNKSEIEFLDAKMAAYYPPFEGVVIGNQVWEASNAMDIVAPDGTAISEVQPNDTASNAELLTNGNFESGLIGALTLGGGETATWTLNAISPISGTQDGRLQVTSVGTSQNRPFITGMGSQIAGRTYKYTFDYKVNSGTPILYAIFNGATFIINKTFSGSGTYTLYFLSKLTSNSITLYFDGRNLFDLQIDNISIKEVGWADRQAVYDYYISIGQSVTEALNAASAWCYYNNSEANGAVYGRQYNNYAVVKLTGSPIWRAPMKADFDQLATFLGGTSVAGGKLKASGLSYWGSPNTGATNESGFTALGGGRRAGTTGVFSNEKVGIEFWSNTETSATMAYWVRCVSGNIILSLGISDKTDGVYLRRLRRIPSGDLVREITSGVFTTNITGGTFKDIPIPNAYRVTALKVTSSTNLTNFTAEVRTSAGELVQSILSNETINAAGTPVIINISARQKLQLQDYVVRITAVGNGGNGMEVIAIIEKAIV